MNTHNESFNKLPQFDIANSYTIRVAFAYISCNQELSSRRKVFIPQVLPPTANRCDGQLDGVTLDTHSYPAMIVRQFIKSAWYYLSEFVIVRVMDVYLVLHSLFWSLAPSIFESPDQLLFLAVNGNNRQTRLLKLLNLSGDVKRPHMSGWIFSTLPRFSVKLRTAPELIQKTPDGVLANLVIWISQFFGQSRCAFLAPGKRIFRTTRSHEISQFVKVLKRSCVAFCQFFGFGRGSRNAPCVFLLIGTAMGRLVNVTQTDVDSSTEKSIAFRDKRWSFPAKRHGAHSHIESRGLFVQTEA